MHNNKGFLTFAQNNSSVNYLELAFIQALNIKLSQDNMEYAVIVDASTHKIIDNEHRLVFDHIIVLDQEYENKFAPETLVFNLTPFTETIKIESDLLFTRNVTHWWDILNTHNILLSFGAKTYKQDQAVNRFYRMMFDSNYMPDIYSGLLYFKKNMYSLKFFLLSQEILKYWHIIKEKSLKYCREHNPSTDVLFSLTALVFGEENCTNRNYDFFNFIHMKNLINGFGDSSEEWFKIVPHEIDKDMIRINNLNQYYPVHYFCKNFITKEYKNELFQRYIDLGLARTRACVSKWAYSN